MESLNFQKYLTEAKSFMDSEPNDETKAAAMFQYLFELFCSEDEDLIENWFDLVKFLSTSLKDETPYAEKLFAVGELLGLTFEFASDDLLFEVIENEIQAFRHVGEEKLVAEKGARRCKIRVLHGKKTSKS